MTYPAAPHPLLSDPDEQRAREEMLRKLAADPECYLIRYTEQFGNVLNADDAATLFEEYNQDRAKYRVAVHPAATWIRDELFARALREKAPEGHNYVAFTAGSNAAGKSTALRYSGVPQQSQAVLDSTLSNPEHARKLLDQALAADKRVIILYVSRPTEDALMGMLERGEREGRLVTIEQLVHSRQGAAETVRRLWGEFRNDSRVNFRFVFNSSAGVQEAGIELTAPEDYTQIRKVLHDFLAREYEAGRISEAVYQRVGGRRNPGSPGGGGPSGEGSSGGS